MLDLASRCLTCAYGVSSVPCTCLVTHRWHLVAHTLLPSWDGGENHLCVFEDAPAIPSRERRPCGSDSGHVTLAGADMPVHTLGQQGPWTWVPRPTIWLLILGLCLLYWYAVTRIGPRATVTGEVAATRSQVAWFAAAMIVLWVASDWPLHDVGENFLYSAHMVQHGAHASPTHNQVGTPTSWSSSALGLVRTSGAVNGSARFACSASTAGSTVEMNT